MCSSTGFQVLFMSPSFAASWHLPLLSYFPSYACVSTSAEPCCRFCLLPIQQKRPERFPSLLPRWSANLICPKFHHLLQINVGSLQLKKQRQQHQIQANLLNKLSLELLLCPLKPDVFKSWGPRNPRASTTAGIYKQKTTFYKFASGRRKMEDYQRE